VWPETDFAELFDTTVFSSIERLKKPDARIYSLICDRLGVSPEACVYIADGENYELAAATDLGMHAVLIRNPLQERANETLREAAIWRGSAISALPETLRLVGMATKT
jgi:FMN phosphatase YigB (HAD superfamily)